MNLVLAWGLWKKRPWAVFAWLTTMMFLQVIPIVLILVMDAFVPDPTQQRAFGGILATHLTMVAVFLLLLPKRMTDQAFDPSEPAGQKAEPAGLSVGQRQ